jgi:hypothetical protein
VLPVVPPLLCAAPLLLSAPEPVPVVSGATVVPVLSPDPPLAQGPEPSLVPESPDPLELTLQRSSSST